MNNNATDNSTTLQTLADAALRPLGFEVLDVQVQNPGRRPIVVIRMDRLDEQPVTMEDLTSASRAVGAEFDRVDPISGEYRLELESPGGKRPLTRARHFERMLGLKARVRGEGHAFTAPIKAVDGERVTFDVGGEDVILTVGTFQGHLAEFPDRHR
ncbi:ribosome maturation factor RimP [Deinococcus hopiensis]|nr:ribosome maturation factor RimP [Deinococcus hopiensis]